MRKKDLMKLTKLTATEQMMKLVREDFPEEKILYGNSVKTYKHYQYYRATVENGILKLAVFSRKLMAAGCTDPEFEIFISKEEKKYITLETATEKWKTAKIDNLDYTMDNGYRCGNKQWYTEETKKIVNNYLGTGEREVGDAVLTYQNDLLGERLHKRHKSELTAIDAVMNAVPELPEDFDDWVMESAFIQERYIFYRAKINSGYCTHCKKEVKLSEKPKHNSTGVCPECKSKVWMKAWGRQKYVTDVKNVGIIQRLTDKTGYVLRLFKCRLARTKDNEWELEKADCWEEARVQLGRNMECIKRFLWGEYKHTRIVRWCYDRDYYYYGNECVLYSRNIEILRKEIGMPYMPMEVLLEKNKGYFCHPIDMIRKLKRNPKMEYLIKTGLYSMTWDLCKSVGEDELNWDAKKPWDVLGLTKDQMQQCIRIDAGIREVKTMKKAMQYGVRLTDIQVEYFTKEVGPGLIGNIAKYGHMEKYQRYFSETLKNTREIGDYFDYLEDIRYLKIQPTIDILFPKNFQQIHREFADQRQEKENALKKMEIKQKDILLQQMIPELEEIYHGENEKFLIVLPTCKADFVREGQENHNCVGGSYYDQMLKGQCVVMFLRKKEEPEKAFCTVEMRGSEIRQCRTIYNREAPEDAMKFMKKVAREAEKRIAKKQIQIRITA